MIPKEKALKLIAIYMYLCDTYEQSLKYYCQRYSNNNNPQFSDVEVMTIYIFAVCEEQCRKVKHIYNFTKNYLHDWFPKLPTYEQFNYRLNMLACTFERLYIELISKHIPADCDLNNSIIDSFPIVTCKGRNRKAKVACEIVDKGYCSTKNMYYYGLKLHFLGYRRKGTIPFPEIIYVSAASENDMVVFKQNFDPFVYNKIIFADKIYIDSDFFLEKECSQNYQILTPVKIVKGEHEVVRQWQKAANDLFYCAVSSVRQPVESFFNWINEKTNIQDACKVRSTAALLVHIFAKMAAAFIYCIF